MERRKQCRSMEIGKTMELEELEEREELLDEYDKLYETLCNNITGKDIKILNHLLKLERELTLSEES